ncbi:MAG TPA: 16S rRNA (uracil(1498)-N(3))-methyltransferase [Paenalcaligenes sp.]|nr:16S rRNA (uracil(1498)-N(3))-methyltransferase [Paenalcaligenes sp.]
MTFSRIYINAPLSVEQDITLPKDKAHYIQRVLRLPAQSQVILFNGQGGEYLAHLHYEGKQVRAVIEEFHNEDRELGLRLTVAQGLATGDKMDWIIEKAVEMGVHSFAPIAAQHSVLKLNPERAEKRVAHWQRIIEAASAQCGRNQLMQLSAPQNLRHFLDQIATDAKVPGHGIILCHQIATTDFVQALAPPAGGWRHLYLLIGPEGGWSDEEIEIALSHEARPLLFGSRVLRAETAAIGLVGAIRGFLHCLD